MKKSLITPVNVAVFLAFILIPTVRADACSLFELFQRPTVTKVDIETCFSNVRFDSSSSGENLSRRKDDVQVLIHTMAFPNGLFVQGTLFLMIPPDHRHAEAYRYRDQLGNLKRDLLTLLYLNNFRKIHAYETHYEDRVVRSEVFTNFFWELAVSLDPNNVRVEIVTNYLSMERIRSLERALGNR